MNDEDGAAKRSAKMTTLLRAFEDYLNEVVASNHGARPEELEIIAIENLQRSLKANVDYHNQMSSYYNDEIAQNNYYKAMANICRCC